MSTLVQRSVLDASGFPLDQIQILGIAARGFHGVLESEREAGQDFSADVTLYLDTRAAARDDDLDETVNYALVAQDVVDILSGEPVDLIETVAEQIAAAVLDRPLVASVDVTVHKPQAPIPVPFSDVTVTINRDRLNVPVVTSPVAPALDELPAEDLAEPRADLPLPVEDPRDAEQPSAALPAAALPAVSFPSAGLAGAPVPSAGIPVAGSSDVLPASLPDELPEAFEPVALRVDETESDVETPTPSSSPTLDLPLGQLTAPVAARESDPASYSTSELHLESDLLHDETGAPVETEPASEAEPAVETGAADDIDDVLLPEDDDQATASPTLVPPVDESLIEEQARLSEQARRPEVFGLRPRTDAHVRPTADDAVPAQGDDHEPAEGFATEPPSGSRAAVAGASTPDTSVDSAPDAAAPETAAPDAAEGQPVAAPAASASAPGGDEPSEGAPSGGPQMGAAFFAAASAAVLNASRDRTPLSFEELLNPSATSEPSAAPAAESADRAAGDASRPTTAGLAAAPATEPGSDAPAPVADAGPAAEPAAQRDQSEQPTASGRVEQPAERPADQPEADETTDEAHATPVLTVPTDEEPRWQPSSFAFPPTGLSTPTEQPAPTAQAGHPQTPGDGEGTSRFAPPTAQQTHESPDVHEGDESQDTPETVPSLSEPEESALETTALLPPLDLDDDGGTDLGVEDTGLEHSDLDHTGLDHSALDDTPLDTPLEEPAPELSSEGSTPVSAPHSAPLDETQLVPTYPAEPDADETQLVETRPEPVVVGDVPQLVADDVVPDDEAPDHAEPDDLARDDLARDALDDDAPTEDTPHEALSDETVHEDAVHEDAVQEDVLQHELATGEPAETADPADPAAGLRPDVVDDLDAPTSPVPVTDPSGVDEAPVSTPHSGSAALAAPALASSALGSPAPGSPAHGSPALAGAERRGETPLQLDRMDARPDEPVDVVLALGANLGDAQGTLRRAVAELDTLTGVDVVEVGPLARTAAVGGPEQPDFLNTVVIVRTTLSPRELLHGCQSVEAGNGRERDVRWGPRTLDIDIVVFGDVIGSATDLELPHPRANERAFVLAPWAHLAPEAHLPGLGGGPVAALAATAHDREGIRWLALDWLHDAELPTAAQTSRPAAVAPALTAVQVVSLPDGETSEEPTTTQALADTAEPSAAPALVDEQPQAAQPEAGVHHDVTHHETAHVETSHQETTAVETAQVWTPDVEPPRTEAHLGSLEPGESPDDTVDGGPAAEDRRL